MANEPTLRALIFLGVLTALALAEAAMPFRGHASPRPRRWFGNFGLFLIGIAVSRIVLPLGAVGFAAWIAPFGLLPRLGLPAWLEIVAAVILLDLAIYAQHVVFHKVPLLWRLHRVHHADTEMDWTTGIRFHPVEIVVSLGFKLAVIALLGADPLAVFLFEVILNAGAMITHANLRLPGSVERGVRLVLVTPGMHRVHHSHERIDTDSNYGFNLAIWDRIFSTYRPEPAPGEEAVVFGLETFRAAGEQRLDRLLTQPLREDPDTPPPR